MALDRYFQDSTKKSYYRQKQIKKIISAISKSYTNDDPINAEYKNQVELLLNQLLDFRRASKPSKFSPNSQAMLHNILKAIASIQRTINDDKQLNIETKAFVNDAIGYISKSIDFRVEHLKKKHIALTVNQPVESQSKESDYFRTMLAPEAFMADAPIVEGSSSVQLDMSQIPYFEKEFLGENQIGQGTFGWVYYDRIDDPTLLAAYQSLGLTSETGEIIIKLNKKNDDKSNQDMINEGRLGDKIREAILKKAPGSEYVTSNTLRLAIVDGLFVPVIIGKYEGGGNLENFLSEQRRSQNPAKTNIDLLAKIYDQQIQGVTFLHSENIIHRDLALRNMFLDAQGNIKIGDFGKAQEIGSHPDAIVSHDGHGPIKIMDHLSIHEHKSNRDTDWFGLKVTMLHEFFTVISGDIGIFWPSMTSQQIAEERREKGPDWDDVYLGDRSNAVQAIINYSKEISDEDRKIYSEFLRGMCEKYRIPPPTIPLELQATQKQQESQQHVQTNTDTPPPPPRRPARNPQQATTNLNITTQTPITQTTTTVQPAQQNTEKSSNARMHAALKQNNNASLPSQPNDQQRMVETTTTTKAKQSSPGLANMNNRPALDRKNNTAPPVENEGGSVKDKIKYFHQQLEVNKTSKLPPMQPPRKIK